MAYRNRRGRGGRDDAAWLALASVLAVLAVAVAVLAMALTR